MGSIQIEGDISALKKQIKKLKEADFAKATPAIAEALRTSTLERFKSAKDPEGKRWETSRRVNEIGGTTLSDKGSLKKSIKAKSDSKSVAVGTNLKYAATHQFGDKNRLIRAKGRGSLRFRYGGQWVVVKAVKVTIPARPYLGINEDDIKEICGTVEDYLSED